MKIFFQPTAKIDLAVAQVTAVSQTQLRQLPPGHARRRFILTYNASTVPVLQLALSGKRLSEQQLFDLGFNFMRAAARHHPGRADPVIRTAASSAGPGRSRSDALQAKGLSPIDVVNAIARAEPDPARRARRRSARPNTTSTSTRSPQTIDELNDLPIKTVSGSTIYIRDVAHVRDGFPPQTNIVRVDGQRAVLMTIQKIGNASTLDIIARIKDAAAADPGGRCRRSSTSRRSAISRCSCARRSTASCARR